MPALPPVNKVVRIDNHFKVDADTNAMWRVFYSYSGALSFTDAFTWCSAIFNAWGAGGSFKALTSATTTQYRAELTDLTSTTAAQAIINGSVTGTAGGSALPAGTALVISFEIGRRYRGGKPRIYLPGIPLANLNTSQTWAPSTLTNFLNAYNVWAAAVVAGAPVAVGTPVPVNVSYFQGFTNVTFPSGRIRPVPKLRSGGPITDIISAGRVNPNVASQRRRNLQP